MDQYRPTSRRPIAEPFRRTAAAAVRLCVKWGVHPDVISYLSLVAAAGAAACYFADRRWPWTLAIAPLFCLLRLWFNMLDGMVALASGKASLRGEIVNELPDRVSDILIFVALAHGGRVNPCLGYWAAIMAIMTAYVGTLGQAVTGTRRFEGLMSKQYRMVVLAAGTWGTLILARVRGDGRGDHVGPLSVLEWTCWIVIAGCVQTIAVRLAKVFAQLRAGRDEGGAA